MKTIYKYTLPIMGEETVLELPLGALILSVACQDDNICLWVNLDPREKLKFPRRFQIFGTGHPMEEIDDTYIFIGTALMRNGALVWHIFEKIKQLKSEK